MLGEFFLLAYTLGPAAAIPYAIDLMNPGILFLTLFIAYTAPLPLLFLVLDRLNYRKSAEKHVLRRIAEKPIREAKGRSNMHKIYESFVNKGGYMGHFLGLATLAFAFGFLWAALIAYVMKLPRFRSYIAIGFGNIAGLLFWIFITVQTKAFINPKWVIIIVLLVTLALFLYGEIRERKILKKIKEKNKDLLSKITETDKG